MRKHRYDTIAEGIGLDRVTANLAQVLNVIHSLVVLPERSYAVSFFAHHATPHHTHPHLLTQSDLPQ